MVSSVVILFIILAPCLCNCKAPHICEGQYMKSEQEWAQRIVDAQATLKFSMFDIPGHEYKHVGNRTSGGKYREEFGLISGDPFTRSESIDMLWYMVRQHLTSAELQPRGFSCENLFGFAEVTKRPLNVHVLGGSVTAGHGTGPKPALYRWTAILQQALDIILGEGVVAVHNYARGGINLLVNWTEQIRRLRSMMNDESQQPDVIIIASQTNDAHRGNITLLNKFTERAVRGMLQSNVSCITRRPLVLFLEDCFHCNSFSRCCRHMYLRPSNHPMLDHSSVADYYRIPSVQWPLFATKHMEVIPRYVDQYMPMGKGSNVFSLHPGASVHFMIALMLLKFLAVVHRKCCSRATGSHTSYPWFDMIPMDASPPKLVPAEPKFLSPDHDILLYKEYTDYGHCSRNCLFMWNAHDLAGDGMQNIMVVSAANWTYDDDHSKWGLHSVAGGNHLQLLLRGTLSDSAASFTPGNVTVSVMYLTSYGHEWGIADILVEPVLPADIDLRRAAGEQLVNSPMVITNAVDFLLKAEGSKLSVDSRSGFLESVEEGVDIDVAIDSPSFVHRNDPEGRYFLLTITIPELHRESDGKLTRFRFKLMGIHIC